MADNLQHSVVWTDVVVVGGGGSGLTAAIEARSLGRQVILIEKNATLGGSTALSVGSISATNTPHQLRKGILASARQRWLKLRGAETIAKVITGVQFKNGTEVQQSIRQETAA